MFEKKQYIINFSLFLKESDNNNKKKKNKNKNNYE